jgi:hypothetical protein
MNWKVYDTAGHLLWATGGPTPPYERGDGIPCHLGCGTGIVDSIEAANL